MIETLNSLLNGLTTETESSTFVFKVNSEDRATSVVESFKNQQGVGGYTLDDSRIKYKCKKDKEGEIVDEYWLVTVKMVYEVM